jgi:PhoH-like ATPase
MKKNYVLDTNVLIHDPKSIFQFEDNNLYIPIYVIEELDKIKSEHSSRGRNSREACRILDELREQGSLSDGVDINDDGKLYIYVPKERKTLNVGLDRSSIDNAILQCFAEIKDLTPPDVIAILVTMDINLRIRAESLKFQTESYESQSVDFSKLVTGMVDYEANNGDIDLLYATGQLSIEDGIDYYYNACVTIKEPSGKTALGRYYKDERLIKLLNIPKEGIFNIKPRNKEQQFATSLLLDDNIKVVSLIGLPGSGKTLLSSLIGLHKTIKEGQYAKLTIARPIVVLGNDIGFLPGSIAEKLDPYMQPIYDQLDLILIGGGKKSKQDKFANSKYEDLIKQGIINVEPITYIRGRSLHNQFVLIDESQNLSTHEVKTILTRCGEGTKIIFTGDPSQIDTPYLDRNSSGISVITEKLHNHPLVGHITMVKGERSQLANLATQRLE